MRRVFRGRLRRDERGVILVMAVPGLILALVATALSVDIGRQVLEKRSDQSVADAAALDAARNPANAQASAEASARRNGFDPTAVNHSVVAQRGKVDANRVFTADPAGSSVLVTVSSHIDYIFAPGNKTLSAKAVATMGGGKQAGFTIGTSLASIDTTRAPLLNAVLGSMIGGSADVVSWKGLVSSHVTLQSLSQQLELLNAGVQFATVDQILTSDVTLAQLATATAKVLANNGDSNAALFLGPSGIIARMTSTATFALGDLISVAAGSQGSALATEFDVWGLLTGAATVANGSNLITVPNIAIAVPNVASVSLSLKVLEGPKTYVGPDATVNTTLPHATTSQVQVTLTPTVSIPISVAGLAGVTVAGSLPVSITAAGATANLTTITCPNPNGSERVTVDLGPLSTSVSAPLSVSASVLGLPFTFNTTTTGMGSLNPTPSYLDFSYPTEFYPSAAAKRVGASPLGLGSMTTLSTTATIGTPPVIPLGLGAVVNAALAVATPAVGPAVSAVLTPVLGSLDTIVMRTLMDGLGISVGAADVTALKTNILTTCGAPVNPGLVN